MDTGRFWPFQFRMNCSSAAKGQIKNKQLTNFCRFEMVSDKQLHMNEFKGLLYPCSGRPLVEIGHHSWIMMIDCDGNVGPDRLIMKVYSCLQADREKKNVWRKKPLKRTLVEREMRVSYSLTPPVPVDAGSPGDHPSSSWHLVPRGTGAKCNKWREEIAYAQALV